MKIKTKHKIIYPFIIMGFGYMIIEIIFKAGYGSMVGYKGIRYESLIGYTSLWMFLVGGLAGIWIGRISDRPIFKKRCVFLKCLIGACIVLYLEFVFGVVFNLWLNMNLWDYSDLPFNLYGQICLLFGVLWFLITPFAIWMDDFLYWILYDDGKLYSLFDLYKKLFTFK